MSNQFLYKIPSSKFNRFRLWISLHSIIEISGWKWVSEFASAWKNQINIFILLWTAPFPPPSFLISCENPCLKCKESTTKPSERITRLPHKSLKWFRWKIKGISYVNLFLFVYTTVWSEVRSDWLKKERWIYWIFSTLTSWIVELFISLWSFKAKEKWREAMIIV